MGRKLDNRGLSLVELLIGITILAIVVVPLIHAFITSAATSNKARNLSSETAAAQNILETYRATTLDAILEKVAGRDYALGGVATIKGVDRLLPGTTDTYETVDLGGGETAAPGEPGYRLKLDDVRAGGKTYDAVMYLNAATDSAKKVNDVEIVNYKPMDAVYIEPNPVVGPSPTPEELSKQAGSPDYIASQTFASLATVDSGSTVPNTYFLGRMTRKITVTIEKKTISGSTVIFCTALFQYQTTYSYTVEDTGVTPPVTHTYTKTYTTEVSNEFFSGGYTDTGSVYGLYFFFYPNTCPGAATPDAIEVLNRGNVPISVILIRQGEEIPGYTPAITLREAYVDYSAPPCTSLHYNGAISYRYYAGSYFYKTLQFDGILVDTEARNRLYEVKVALYRDGADPETDKPLAVFDASSLE